MAHGDYAGLPHGDSPIGKRPVTAEDVAKWAAECEAEDRIEDAKARLKRSTASVYLRVVAAREQMAGLTYDEDFKARLRDQAEGK